MSEERKQVSLTDAQIEALLVLVDRELAVSRPLMDLAEMLRAARGHGATARPPSPGSREPDSRRT